MGDQQQSEMGDTVTGRVRAVSVGAGAVQEQGSEVVLLTPRSVRIADTLGSSGAAPMLGCLTGNQVSLLTAAFLFALITGVQYVFGKIANSMALQADCMSMGVDALTYLGALAAECFTTDDIVRKRRFEISMAGISYVILLYFTLDFILESYDTVSATSSGDDEEDVNGYIVLGFALGGLCLMVSVYSSLGSLGSIPSIKTQKISRQKQSSRSPLCVAST